jgi:hypothetical protein
VTSTQLHRRVTDLEHKAQMELERQVDRIYARYNYDVEVLKAYASDDEIRTIMKLEWPKQLETFKGVWSIVSADIYKLLFEHELYPLLYRCMLSAAVRDDDDVFLLESHLDLLYDRLVHPDLTKRFWDEAIPPDPDLDPDGFANHRISEECAALLHDARRERDALKDRAFEQMKTTLVEEYRYEAETLRLDAQWQREEEEAKRKNA